MSLFKTPTPEYQQQTPRSDATPVPGVIGQLMSLFRTPTPAYRSAPVTFSDDVDGESQSENRSETKAQAQTKPEPDHQP